jgi:hypothetical protein
MNLWIIEIIMKHKGVIIVDSTQRGKKIPDALSKTIPIWCCVINRYRMMIDNIAEPKVVHPIVIETLGRDMALADAS